MIHNDKVDALEAEIRGSSSKLDKRRRWTIQVIERMRVTERACHILVTLLGHENPGDLWYKAQRQAIAELKKEGKLR